MLAPPRIRGGTAARAVSLVAGLFLFALGIVALLESGLGLSPWDVLNQGISDQTSLSFGTANVVVALGVLVVAWALGATIGPGTVANAVLIGLFVDLLLRVGALDQLSEEPLGVRVALMIGGILVIGVGSGFYIGAGMGAGPRDSLMLVSAVTHRRAHRRRAGRARDRGHSGRVRARRHRRDRDARVRVRHRARGRAVLLGAGALAPRRPVAVGSGAP